MDQTTANQIADDLTVIRGRCELARRGCAEEAAYLVEQLAEIDAAERRVTEAVRRLVVGE